MMHGTAAQTSCQAYNNVRVLFDCGALQCIHSLQFNS
jgi:hypothetical protein